MRFQDSMALSFHVSMQACELLNHFDFRVTAAAIKSRLPLCVVRLAKPCSRGLGVSHCVGIYVMRYAVGTLLASRYFSVYAPACIV